MRGVKIRQLFLSRSLAVPVHYVVTAPTIGVAGISAFKRACASRPPRTSKPFKVSPSRPNCSRTSPLLQREAALAVAPTVGEHVPRAAPSGGWPATRGLSRRPKSSVPGKASAAGLPPSTPAGNRARVFALGIRAMSPRWPLAWADENGDWLRNTLYLCERAGTISCGACPPFHLESRLANADRFFREGAGTPAHFPPRWSPAFRRFLANAPCSVAG